MEFRHDSWAAARDRLLDAGVGWCVAETDEKDPKPEDLSWEPVGYLRLRKTEYSDEELREWAGRIQPALDGGATIFCYFKHEDEGASPKMAKRLEAMLQVPPRATMPVAAVKTASTAQAASEVPAAAGKTQYFTATSIDGYIADQDNSLDWLFQAHDDRTARAGGTRSSAPSVRWRWAPPPTSGRWSTRSCSTIRRSGTSTTATSRAGCSPTGSCPAIPNADIRFVQGEVRAVHEEMTAAAGGKNIWLVGGGELVGRFADEGLLDEIQLHVAPVTLGAGAPLLPRRITRSASRSEG